MRNLRWWAARPICDRDGLLSIGYAYPNALICEGYNGLGAPAWALKAFSVLALRADHPFWTAEEEPPEALPQGERSVPGAGFVLQRAAGQAVMLTGGQDGRQFRGGDAKYGGFAYGTIAGFSVPSDSSQPERPAMSAMDSGLAVSRDGLSWIRRGRITRSGLRDGMAWGLWSPDARLRIESWSAFAGPGWHVRLHRISSEDALDISETGFAVDRTGLTEGDVQRQDNAIGLRGGDALSRLVDLGGERAANLIHAAPNTNLLYPRTWIPRLTGSVPAGETVLLTAALICPRGAQAPDAPRCPEAFSALARRLGRVI